MWFGVGWFEGSLARIGIKYAESPDGFSWQLGRDLALVPGDNGEWDYTHTETPTVVYNPDAEPERRYQLWYAGANDLERQIFGQSHYQIGMAYSGDGRNFERLPAQDSPYGLSGLVLMASQSFPGVDQVADGVLADPEVVLDGDIYRLWATAIGTDDREQVVTAGIGYATSTDGIHWTSPASNPVIRGGDRRDDGPAQVTVAESEHGFEAWFTNHMEDERMGLPPHGVAGFWKGTSVDGQRWSIDYDSPRDFRWAPTVASESYALWTGAEVVVKDNTEWIFYGAESTGKRPNDWPGEHMLAINIATRRR